MTDEVNKDAETATQSEHSWSDVELAEAMKDLINNKDIIYPSEAVKLIRIILDRVISSGDVFNIDSDFSRAFDERRDLMRSVRENRRVPKSLNIPDAAIDENVPTSTERKEPLKTPSQQMILTQELGTEELGAEITLGQITQTTIPGAAIDKNVPVSTDKIWERGDRALATASGGAFVGGLIGQLPGAVAGAVFGAVFGLFVRTQKRSRA
jgi:hypothetical protein